MDSKERPVFFFFGIASFDQVQCEHYCRIDTNNVAAIAA
jgi:hypothetical protein